GGGAGNSTLSCGAFGLHTSAVVTAGRVKTTRA
ncbi:hypothetical protein PR002_g31386, partial [Phytophthora rubi]